LLLAFCQPLLASVMQNGQVSPCGAQAHSAPSRTAFFRVVSAPARLTRRLTPLGYAVDKTTGQYVIVPREAEAVQLIFNLYQQGAGYTEIIDRKTAVLFVCGSIR